MRLGYANDKLQDASFKYKTKFKKFVITARNSSWGKVMFSQVYVKNSVYKRGRRIPACLARSHDQHYISSCIALQSHWSRDSIQVTSNARWVRWHGMPPGQTFPRQTPPFADTPLDRDFPGRHPSWILQDTVNERAVRILLECILVSLISSSYADRNNENIKCNDELFIILCIFVKATYLRPFWL